MNRTRRWIHAALFTSLITAKVFAVEVNVNIKGCITDQKSKEPLIGATVQIVGSSIGAVTDMDGNFQLSGVEDGIYDIEIKYVGYKTAIKRQVKIENNKITTLDFEMVTDEHLLSDVVVVAKANRESESVTLLEQKRSVVAVQAVGAKELARKGVSDAQAAVTKISGISKQEGVKMSLSADWATVTTSPLSTAIPFRRKTLNTRILPSTFLHRRHPVGGSEQGFYGNTSADASGANINITSKELTGDATLDFSLSGGVNTQALSGDLLQASGSNLFGFANTTQPGEDLKSYRFKNAIDPSQKNIPINQDYSLSGGKQFRIHGNPLSFFIVASHHKTSPTTTRKCEILSPAAICRKI